MIYDISGLTTPQQTVFLDQSRFRVLVAGRRFGKTTLAITECIYEAQRGCDRLVWYIAPTYDMAKDLVWDDLKKAIPQEMIAYKNESDLCIVLKGFNSKIVLKGADRPDRLRGKGLDHVVMDEDGDIKGNNLWKMVIRPALTDKEGTALHIGTPKGYNWFYDLYDYALTSDEWSAYQYTTAEGGNVTDEELAKARATVSDREYRQEYEASFETLSNVIYHSFDRADNCDNGVVDIGSDIMIGMDFNVDPMSATIGSKVGNQLHIFDEIVIMNSNTEEMCEEIKHRYPDRKVHIFPDPSGNARKTSATVGKTDHTIIRSYGFDLCAPSKAPAIVDRINEVNALCKTADGTRRLFVNPIKCKQLVKSMVGLTRKDGTSLPDKSSGLDHMTDALGYKIHMLFPINKRDMKKVQLVGL